MGLWNFDDPTLPLRDRSPNGHHGQLVGQATITNAALPVIVSGRITDAAGNPLTNATVEIHQAGHPTGASPANAAASMPSRWRPPRRCDLFVTTGELSAYRLGFQPGESQQRLDWVLTDAEKAPAVPGLVGTRSTASPSVSASRMLHAGDVADAVERVPTGVSVVATVLTDEQGNFEFPNLKPGAYQVRAQIPGGRAWYEAGRILYADPDATEAERARLAKLDFQLAPFNKGRWRILQRAGRTEEQCGRAHHVHAGWCLVERDV